jgi:hypothetical protein
MNGHKIIGNHKELQNHMESMLAFILPDSKEINSPNALLLRDCILRHQKGLTYSMQSFEIVLAIFSEINETP